MRESDILELIETELSSFSPYNIAGNVYLEATIVVPIELPDGWSGPDAIDEIAVHVVKEFSL